MSKLGEKLLLAVSRAPGSPDYGEKEGEASLVNALSPLRRTFPALLTEIAGKQVLDFGSGHGLQAVAMALQGARRIVGIDTNPEALRRARALAAEHGVADRVAFAARLDATLHEQFDLAISQNSMEHFEDPEDVLALMQKAVRPAGKILVTFGPPWYAPYGSHMQFFCRVPWLNLLFSESTVMSVRRHFRDDGARRYREVESGLNQITVRRFERIVERSGMRVESLHLDCVKGLDALARLPGLRELFVNHITCVLTHPSSPAHPADP